MDDLQERMQVFLRHLEWELLTTFNRIPATQETLAFILQQVKQEFKDELDGRVLDIRFDPRTNSAELSVRTTTGGQTDE